ncbi:MAG: 3-methylmercaptopropionyl-CoA ligase [Rhodospirillaceae bacterium]|nr:long-chain fatty acid--CoA ligase [Alphaproteobacteria bacterium]CAI8327056.1 MAG: 3-methylmercaptopropionyl-CoA ligase [Rhodospirillaceae bacterium]
MKGLMQNAPLMISSLLQTGADVFGGSEVVSVVAGEGVVRHTYRDINQRAKQLAQALGDAGIGMTDRVATLAWNDHRHLEIYYGVSGIGAVCHTINPRLFPEQLIYIINHAEDRIIMVDPMFLPLIEKIIDNCPKLEKIVVLCTAENLPDTALDAVVYEDFIGAFDGGMEWPEFDENAASSLCYTSGTTGNPKGALYSHRSTVLHALMAGTPAVTGTLTGETMMPVVPMFHVNAWGQPYYAPLVGAKLVLPGPKLDGESLYNLIQAESVSNTAGVPTIWLNLLKHTREVGGNLDSLRNVIIGGSAAPGAMIREFEDDYQTNVIHAWGMTEMSPLGSAGVLAPHLIRSTSADEQFEMKQKQGHRVFGVDMRIVNDDEEPQPHDGTTRGHLVVRGPWIISSYYNNHDANDKAFTKEGWFYTGDIATLDENNILQLVDRSKDVIKSGGEWISSIDLENEAVGIPGVVEAAVIGVAHDKWGERPVLILVPQDSDNPPSEDSVRDFLGTRIAKWWMPDLIVFKDEIPHGATGKILKAELREEFRGALAGATD